MGAIDKVYMGSKQRVEIYDIVIKYLEKLRSDNDIVDFNDSPKTHFKDIQKLVKALKI